MMGTFKGKSLLGDPVKTPIDEAAAIYAEGDRTGANRKRLDRLIAVVEDAASILDTLVATSALAQKLREAIKEIKA